MSRLLPLVPFVGFLALLSCGDEGPVAEEAQATRAPSDAVVGDAAADGIAAPANSAAAEAVDRAALPPQSAGMAWFVAEDRRAARFGPPHSEPQLTIACTSGSVAVTRHHPAPRGASGTLSLTGGGHVASLPVAAAATTSGPGEAEWRGVVTGDTARAIARTLSRGGQVEISLGGAPSLIVPASRDVMNVIAGC